MSISTNKPLVIVTGSSGYIGSAVITALASDYQLVGFDREAAPHPPAVAECVCIDLTKEKSGNCVGTCENGSR
ncbi:NAD-dependent epimerase/dehydratase family protein [Paraglaciecola sp. Hal342]